MLNSPNIDQSGNPGHPVFGNSLLTGIMGSRGLTNGFAVLDAKPVFEVVGLDFTTMVAPRIIVDYQQNPEYGRETAVRELSTMFIMPFMSNFIGMGIMSAKGLGGLYTNSSALSTLHAAWNEAGNTSGKEKLKQYVKNVLNNTEGQVGEEWRPLRKTLSKKDFRKYVDEIADIIENGGKDTSKKLEKVAKNLIKTAQAEGNIRVTGLGEGLSTSMNELLRDTATTAQKVFTRHEGEALEQTVEKLGKLIRWKSAIAVSASAITGFSMQYINAAITKLKTGDGGFSGYKTFGTEEHEKRETEEHSPGFTIKKVAAALGMGLLTMSTMSGFKKTELLSKKGWKDFIKAMELRGPYAHMNILKFVVGCVFAGRAIAIRDETELTTTPVRDFTTFINWLVIGPLLAKGIAGASDPSLFNGKVEGDNIFKRGLSWLNDTSLKTTDEIKSMWPDNREKLAIRNTARVAGLTWTLFTLGIGMPYYLNHYIINKSHKNKNENLNKNSFADFINNHMDVYANHRGLLANG